MTHVEPPSAATVLAGRYRLERRIAQGGMAEVWLATDLSLNRQVAVKLLKPHLAVDPVIAERFRREAIAVASITHPNIVAVYDTVSDGDRQAVVMHYVQGKTLRRLLDEQRQLSPELTVHVGSALASALDAAHSAGLVHRDVKPGNVMVTPEGRVLLTDFGIAKALGSGDDLTSDNVMMGTAKYLSPEQVRGRRLDGRADLYALGLVLYECLAGRVPFQGETDADTALARLQRDPTDLMRLRPTLPRGLVDVVQRLIQREPDNRYPTGASVRTALSKALAPPEAPVEVAPTPSVTATPHAQPPTPTKVVRSPSRSDRTPSTSHVPRPRDRTPVTPSRRRPSPPPNLQQQWKPSVLVVGGLLLIAMVMVIVLWAGARGDGSGGPPTTPPASGDVTTPVSNTSIANVSLFDPDGDQTENADGAFAAVTDNDPSTTWRTLCYAGTFLNGKAGVGLILQLAEPAAGALSVTVANTPYQIGIYAVDGAAPGKLPDWGSAVHSTNESTSTSFTVEIPDGTANILVAFHQIGRDANCGGSYPYRGIISDVVFTPSS